MEVVKIAKSPTAEIGCTVQYLRADISKSVAALRKLDSGTWYECRDELSINLAVLIREGDALMAGKELDGTEEVEVLRRHYVSKVSADINRVIGLVGDEEAAERLRADARDAIDRVSSTLGGVIHEMGKDD